MAKSRHYYIRRTHRYLGLILGIQFLIWTISGLYFAWSDIDEIHGDFQHKHPALLAGNTKMVSPDSFLQRLDHPLDSLQSLQLVAILGKPFYHVKYFSANKSLQALVNAETGRERPAITKEEAVSIAAESFAGESNLRQIRYIDVTNGHHEYREKPLPAWAVTFDHSTNTTVYVSAIGGKVESFRNAKWRIFDFLWMGHTMDYENRDDINNWLLRLFSAFGLVTVLSGFVLFWVSRKRRKKYAAPAV
jgi:hypothetical protein